jgi:hypothetical protein
LYITKLISEGETKFWTRDKGTEVRNKILSEFELSGESILVIDFTGVEIVDFSFASEVVAISVSRLAKELSGKHILIRGMNKSVEENVSVAIERAALCVLIYEDENAWKLIGKYSDALLTTFKLIKDLKKTDTPTLAEKLNSTIPVMNNRLRALTDLGLVIKEESSAPSGGKQYNYYCII